MNGWLYPCNSHSIPNAFLKQIYIKKVVKHLYRLLEISFSKECVDLNPLNFLTPLVVVKDNEDFNRLNDKKQF